MRIVFMGTPDFAVPCLDALVNNGYEVIGVVTQPDKPVGRSHSRLVPPPVKEAALKHGIKTIMQPEKVKTREFVESIRELAPDLIVVVAYGRILIKDVLDIPKHGCINIHASLLPKYRGAAPIQWAIINGDEKTGITAMLMDEGMDTGDILLAEEIPISPDMTSGELFDRLRDLGAKVLIETLRRLENGTLTRIPQNHAEAVYVPMMKKEIGLIDWSKSAHEIHNLVRGTDPWPGAYTFYKGKRMKIKKTAVLSECPGSAREPGTAREDAQAPGMAGESAPAPGTILKISGQDMIVSTGNGCLKISELQFENCRWMSVSECGHNMDEGEVLG
ncbi:MAG: methionyl-tRNA formyltransferase [Bacillota bacterium]